jgi:aldehyde:ferredoxin oxidoreductase
MHLNDLCDRLGIDTMTAGNLAGLTIEAVRQGRIDYPIDYGQPEAVARLVEDIAARRGIGDTLARGIWPPPRNGAWPTRPSTSRASSRPATTRGS